MPLRPSSVASVVLAAGLTACTPGGSNSSSSSSSGSGGASSSGDAGAPSSDAAVAGRCGDGNADDGEECDGAALRDVTCVGRGYDSGEARCTDACTLDLTPCVVDPCQGYACAPFGPLAGDVIGNIGFSAANEAAWTLAGDDDTVDMRDLYRLSVTNGGAATGLLLFVSTAWCPYCAEESDLLEPIYQDLKDQGVLILGLVLEDSHGNSADMNDANNYADGHDWTLPAVYGRLDEAYWPADAEEAGGVPMHLFVDLRNMRIYGKIGGYMGVGVVRQALEALAAGPTWGPNGERVVSFDCAPGVGTESEPNALAETPEDLTARPGSLTGVVCPPQVAEDIYLDEDALDLGVLAAGTLVEVTMTPGAGSDVYPYLSAYRLDAAGESVEWHQWGPVFMSGDPLSRQLLVDAPGHYVLVASDARVMAGGFYGDATAPASDACCGGGVSSTYTVAVASGTLAVSEPALALNDIVNASLDEERLQVFPVDVVQGTSYNAKMAAADRAKLDAYIVVYDPATGAIIGANDDIDTEAGNTDALVSFTATATGTVWVVAGYYVAYFRGGAPSYRIYVEQPTK